MGKALGSRSKRGRHKVSESNLISLMLFGFFFLPEIISVIFFSISEEWMNQTTEEEEKEFFRIRRQQKSRPRWRMSKTFHPQKEVSSFERDFFCHLPSVTDGRPRTRPRPFLSTEDKLIVRKALISLAFFLSPSTRLTKVKFRLNRENFFRMLLYDAPRTKKYRCQVTVSGRLVVVLFMDFSSLARSFEEISIRQRLSFFLSFLWKPPQIALNRNYALLDVVVVVIIAFLSLSFVVVVIIISIWMKLLVPQISRRMKKKERKTYTWFFFSC